MKIFLSLIFLVFSLFSSASKASQLPEDFVYLRDVDPTIVQEMRYAGYHNFLGRPIHGYMKAECIVTRKTALALHDVQLDLLKSGLSLKVYDCYRPQTAVDDFIASHNDLSDQRMKAEFYPRISKSDFFKSGYVAEKSGHSRGSTVDLTIIPNPPPGQQVYFRGQKLTDCAAPESKRFHDNSIEMGTGFDCFDLRAHVDSTDITPLAIHNRSVLRVEMMMHGFAPYENEWWHFTLKNEPHANTYFNFPVE